MGRKGHRLQQGVGQKTKRRARLKGRRIERPEEREYFFREKDHDHAHHGPPPPPPQDAHLLAPPPPPPAANCANSCSFTCLSWSISSFSSWM